MSTGNKRCDRVNLGAKLLSGEEYGGHAFWDTELFMLPYFAFVFPKTAQNLENYRFHLLDAAAELDSITQSMVRTTANEISASDGLAMSNA